jgi:Ca2+-binding EF-hand superfamily protein
VFDRDRDGVVSRSEFIAIIDLLYGHEATREIMVHPLVQQHFDGGE